MPDSSFDRWAMRALLIAAMVIRAVVGEMAGPQVCRSDVDNYEELAQGLIDHGTYGYDSHLHGLVGAGEPTAQRPPLYPFLLAACACIGQPVPPRVLQSEWIWMLNVVVGTLTVWLVARIGRRWELGRWRFLAGAVAACDPILLRQSTEIMTETLAAFVAALGLTALTAAVARLTVLRALASGATLGLAVLCRPTFLVWGLAAPLAFWWLLPRGAPRYRLVVSLYVASAVLLAPWAIRNAVQFGRPIITTTHGGFTLLLANNPDFYIHLRNSPTTPWDASALNEEFRDARIRYLVRCTPKRMFRYELIADQAAYARAWQSIRNHTGMFLYSCAFRLSRLWGVLPLALPGQSSREQVLRYATAVFYMFELLLALVGVWSLCRRDACTATVEDRSWDGRTTKDGASEPCGAGVSPALLNRPLFTTPWLFGLLLAASFTAVHTLYWTDMRMRAPLVPVVALAAAAGADWSYVRFARRNQRPDK
jgi:4-amino-4-deoxy-L-arabinose transferase-like glycosyltransferase